MRLKEYPRQPSRGLVPVGEILWSMLADLLPSRREQEQFQQQLAGGDEERDPGWWESIMRNEGLG
jgi:hypothetical protein